MPTRKTKNVVVIGGGNGSAIALNALKIFVPRVSLSAIVSSSDNGFSSGALRKKFNMLPPGDIMRAVLAMSPYDYTILKTLFYKNRLSALPHSLKKIGGTRNPNIGNLFLALVSQFEGDFVRAVRALEQAVEAVGTAYPVTRTATTLCVSLTNGDTVQGEEAIDRPTYNRKHKITRAWLKPTATIATDAAQAIRKADVVILAPGSLYASLIATLLPRGVAAAIRKSRAKLVYIAGDAYETNGETGPESLSGFVEQLERYLPRAVDVVVYNNARLTPAQTKAYRQRHWASFKKDIESVKGHKLVGADFERADAGLSPDKLATILQKIIFA